MGYWQNERPCLTVGEGSKVVSQCMAVHGHGSTTLDIAFSFAVIARASLFLTPKSDFENTHMILPHTESGIITSSVRQRRIIVPTCRLPADKVRASLVVVDMPPPLLTVGVGDGHIVTGHNLIYCIRSKKTSISAMSVVGIFIYIPSTLPDRRKANPGFTNSPFKCLLNVGLFIMIYVDLFDHPNIQKCS